VSEGISDILVKRYAQTSGLSEEEARQVLEAIREKRPDRFEQLRQTLELLSEYGEKVKDPLLLTVLKPMIADQIMGGREEDSIADKISRAIREAAAAKLAVDSVTKILGEKREEPPPPQVPQEVVDSLNRALNEIDDLKKKLSKARKSKTLKLIKALEEQVKGLRDELQKVKEAPPKEEDEIERIVQKMHERKEKAKEFLEALGYTVKEGEIPPERVKELAEKYGWKVVEAKVSLEELERLKREMEERIKREVEEAYKRGREDAQREIDEKMLEKQLNALQNIVQSAVDRVIGEVIGPVVRNALAGQIGGGSGGSGASGESTG